jgi:hypothetical protein
MTKARTAQRKGGNQAPISAHPAFPAIVALWFAALLGIGTVVLPNILIEKIVDTTGLAAIIPAAAPPIGFTAKLTLAALAALAGVGAGIFVARKVVESQNGAKAVPVDRREARSQQDIPAKRPIVATEELGEEGLGPVADEDYSAPAASKPPLPGRRRALSVTDDSGPSPYLSHVPLPGEGDPLYLAGHAPTASGGAVLPSPDIYSVRPGVANRADGSNILPDAAAEAQDHAEAEHEQALGGLRNQAVANEPRPFDAPLVFPAQPATGGDGADYHFSETPAAEALPETGASQFVPAPDDEPIEENEMTNSGFGSSFGSGFDGSTSEHASPVTSYNPFASQAAPQPAPFVAPRAPAQTPVFASHAFAPTSFAAPAAAPAAPLAELTMAELIARFARSMQGDAAPAIATAPAAPVAESGTETETFADDPFASAPAVPFAFARADDNAPAPFSVPQPAPVFAAAAPTAEQAIPVPAALRPLDLGAFEEDDSEDDPFAATPGFSFGAPERMFERPADAAPAPEQAPAFAPPLAPQPFVTQAQPALPVAFADPLAGADDDDTGNDDGYSSLLSMKSPLGNHREFPRVEDDEPIVAAAAPEAVVIFPGQGSPAAIAARPFDAPTGATPTGGLARAVPTMPAQKPADPAETERALREALEKLQRMSGAA